MRKPQPHRRTTQPLAIVYARVSSKDQADGFSIPAQLKLLEEYAAKNGLKVARVFQEAETAKRAGRRAFKEMLAYLDEHPRSARCSSRRPTGSTGTSTTTWP